MIQFISKTFNLLKTFNPLSGGKNMKKTLSIILNLLLILSFVSFGYAAEEYVYVTKWTPNGNPRGIATDEDGNVYVAGDQTVVKYTREGALVFTIQNIPNNDDYNLGSWDMAVVVDSSGYIYVSNEQDHNVVKFDSTGSYVTKWGSQGSEDNQFNEPKGIAISNGYVYVCDRGNNRIIKFDIDGTFISSFGQEGWEDGQFQRPRDIVIDSTNSEIFVTEEWNSRIQAFDLDGTFKRKWATDSSAGDGEINSPRGIALDSQGNVYVTDEAWMANKIVKFASDGTFILKFGGYGTDNYHFHGLQGIAVDYSDNVYVIDLQNWDWENRRILKYRLKGSPTIQVTSPTENEFVTGSLAVQATVTVPAGYTLSKVEFYIEDTLLGEVTSSPYEYSLDTTAYTNGAYTIWVVATNTEGTASRENVSITVANGDDAPTVSITEPTDQEKIMEIVDITADASDDIGIAKVEFYADDIKLGEATSSPYTYSWDTTTVQDGEMIVKVIAYDTIGQTAEASIYVTVTNSEEYSYIAQWYTNNPRSIALDQSGNLYVAGDNRIKKFSSDGTELLTIEDNGMGEYRFSWQIRVAVDQSSGSIYVTNSDEHKVMKFDSTGNFIKQWGSLGTGNSNLNRPEGVAVDSSGFVYVCDGENRRIVKYNSDGNYQAKWGSQGSGIGQFEYPVDVAIDSSDNIYVLDRWSQSVKVFTSTGTYVRKWGGWGFADGKHDNPEGIGIDSEDYIYVADSGNRRVVKYASDGTFITKWGTQGSGDYNFNWPMDVAVDSSGYVYVADSDNSRVSKFRSAWLPTVSITNPAAGATISEAVTIQATAASGTGISKVEFYIDDVLKSTDTESPYEYLWDVTAEVDGVKVYSNGEYEIKAVAYNTQNKSTEAAISVVVNDGGDSPPKLSITNPLDGATVMLTVSIKADASDFEGIDRVEFYLDDTLLGTDTESPYEYIWDATTAEDGEKTIKVIAFDTIGQTREATISVTVMNNEEFGFLNKWYSDNPRGIAVDSEGYIYVAGGYRITKFTPEGSSVLIIEEDWQSGDYWFSWNMHVAVDSEGYIYVSTEENNQIIKFDSSGDYLLKWGSQGYGDDQFNGPQGLTADSEGNVYVCDQWNHRVLKFDSSGNFLSKFGVSQGWGEGQFSDPKDVAVDSSGNIYVADSGNNRIQVFSPDGTFLRMWGNWGFGDYQFDWPEGIALDSEGKVYIADTWNQRVVKYSSDGTFLAKWGSQGNGDYQFDEPRDIAVDSFFNVYVADSGWNNRIMKFRSTWLPSIEITNPVDNSTVSATATIQASVDSTLEISKVEFYLDDTLLGEDTSSPYSYDWDTTSESDGPHTIKVTAYNIQSTTAEAEISVVVNNSGDEYPTVSITNPAADAIVSVAVSIKAEATDDVGIAKVEFYVDDVKVGEDTSSPYEFTWDATKVEDGEKTIKVKAYDTIGQNVEASVEVTVDNNEEFSYVAKWTFDNPTSIALDKDGNLYVAGGNKIKKYNSDGTLLLTIDDRKGMAEYRFDWDMYITIDQTSGDIYVINQFESRVIKFSSEGQYISQWGSPGGADDQFNWPHGVATDSEGNVYVCDTDNKRIVKFDSEGTFLAKFGGDSFSDLWLDGPQDIVLDESGNMYITEGWGHRVKAISPEGNLLDEWGEWGFDDTRFQEPKGIALDSDGFLYIADSNNNRIVKYTTDGRFLTKWGSMGTGDENFSWPQDVAVDSLGYVYVADRNNNRVVKFKSAWLPTIQITSPIRNEFVSGAVAIEASVESALEISKVEFYIDETLVGEDALTPYSYDWDTTLESDGTHTLKVIASTVQGKTQDAEISVVVNNSNDAIPEISITSPEEGANLRRTVELQAEATDDNGIAKVEFYADDMLLVSDTESPYAFEFDTETVEDGAMVLKAIAYDTIGQNVEAIVNVTVRNTDSYEFYAEYKTDWEQEHGYGNPDSITIDQYGRVYVAFHERIAMFTAKGNFLGVIENEGSNDEYKLTHDMHIAVDKYGDIYATCPGTFKVLKFDSSGNFLTEWGAQGKGDGEFSRPQGIAVDSEGNVYVCDGWNHDIQDGNRRIQKFDSEGTFLASFGGEDMEFPQPPDQTHMGGHLENPTDIALDASDNIYVVDAWMHRVIVFDTEGNFLRSWGDWGYGDLQFQNPEGLCVDSEGYIYVADTGNHRIVKYSPEGIFRGKWGSQGYGEYSFEWPRDVAVSPAGYVFVADNNNQRVVVYQMKGMPTVEITTPTDESILSGEVAIQMTAGSEYGISKVELYIDGTLKGEATQATHVSGIRLAEATSTNYEYTWDTVLDGNGSHDIEAVAYNSDGNSASAEITVIVNNGGDAAPTLSITNPSDDAIIRGVVSIKTQVSDDVGIDKVEFYAANTLLHTLTELPFEYSWDTTTGDDGQQEIKVIAYDSIGQKTWATVSVTVDNENRIFSINLTGAAVIYLTKDHTLKKLDTSGYEGYVINENVKVQQFQFDPLGNLYIVFEQHQQLADGESYILVKVDPATNTATGIDSSLSNLVWNERSVSSNLQFDDEGNVYYFAESQTDEGDWMRVLRKYVDKDNIEDIINRNMQIYHWQVRDDGTIVIAGKTLSNNETWLRKVDPESEESKVVNLAEPDWQDEWGWMAKFPDDLIYVTLTGSYLGLDGIYRLGDDLARLQEEDADAPYIGDKEGSLYNINELTADHSEEYIKGITEQGRVRDMISIQTDDAGNVYGLAGNRNSKYRTVMRLYPVPEVVEPQLIDRAQMMTVSFDQLVIAGFDNQTGTYKLVLYNISTRNELNLMYSNIEIYHLGTLANGSILFDGLNLDTNKVIIGMFERAAGAPVNISSLSADDFGLTVLSEIGSESDKPLGFGVIKNQDASSDILIAAVSSPSHGSTVSETVEIKATATAEYGVSKVEFYINSDLVETDTDSPYSYSWDTTSYDDGSYTIKVIVYDTQAQTASSQVTVTVGNTPGDIRLREGELFFGMAAGSESPSSQVIVVTNSGVKTLNWTATSSESWLEISPESGTGTAKMTVSADPTGLSAGTYTGTITIEDPNAGNSPQTISVTFVIHSSTQVPFGAFDTPNAGTTGVTGATPVSGWALDDIEVTKVEIWREPMQGEATAGNGLVYIGDALLIEGARSDVEQDYANYPLNYRAGWGYMLLTHGLPEQGNGSYTLHAIAYDKEGNSVDLGTKTITCDNSNASKPFGAIDTPTQGGEATGDSFVNFGWVLTPQPNYLEEDGSTITVVIDGEEAGQPEYNQYRSDVAELFPGYANSEGAVGYYYIDTTAYDSGVHTITWTAEDSAGNTDDIGTRYFTIFNTEAAGRLTGLRSHAVNLGTTSSLEFDYYLTTSFDPLAVIRGSRRDAKPELKAADSYGIFTIEIRETERVRIELGEGTDYKGFLVVRDVLRPLPIGSTLNKEKGTFSWHPGPGFIGEYNFIFLVQDETGLMKRISLRIRIVPKFSSY